MSNLVDLNERAQDSFNRLRNKMKLDLQAPLIKKGIDINEKKIQEMLNTPFSHADTINTLKNNPALNEAIEEAQFVDNSFSFIESLNLPPQLSLVIGMLISFNKTNNEADLINARKYLKEFVLMKGYSSG